MKLHKLLSLIFIFERTVVSNFVTSASFHYDRYQRWNHDWTIDILIRRTFVDVITVYHCLGSLVHERAVLTSAQCLNRTTPSAENTKIQVYGDTYSDIETGIRLTNIHPISNVSYHDWQKEYDGTKLDYALIILFFPIFFDNVAHLINLANESIIDEIDFNNCILTSFTRDKRKHEVPVKCVYIYISNKLNCTSKDENGGFYDSGSPVSCRLFEPPELVLVGFISKYRRYSHADGSRTLVPMFTSIIPVGSTMHYDHVTNYINTI